MKPKIKRILSIFLLALMLVFSAGPIVSAQTVRHRHVRHRTFWPRDQLEEAVLQDALGGIEAQVLVQLEEAVAHEALADDVPGQRRRRGQWRTLHLQDSKTSPPRAALLKQSAFKAATT